MIPTPELNAACKRAGFREKLKDVSDDKLVSMVRLAKQRFEGAEVDSWRIDSMPNLWYSGSAAGDVLRDRHGSEWLFEQTGIPTKIGFLDRAKDYVNRTREAYF